MANILWETREEKTWGEEKSFNTEAKTGVIQTTAKESLELPEGEEARKDSFCQAVEAEWPFLYLILEFWPPEMLKNKFLLFQATKFVVTCYCSHRKLIQLRQHFIAKVTKV